MQQNLKEYGWTTIVPKSGKGREEGEAIRQARKSKKRKRKQMEEEEANEEINLEITPNAHQTMAPLTNTGTNSSHHHEEKTETVRPSAKKRKIDTTLGQNARIPSPSPSNHQPTTEPPKLPSPNQTNEDIAEKSKKIEEIIEEIATDEEEDIDVADDNADNEVKLFYLIKSSENNIKKIKKKNNKNKKIIHNSQDTKEKVAVEGDHGIETEKPAADDKEIEESENGLESEILSHYGREVKLWDLEEILGKDWEEIEERMGRLHHSALGTVCWHLAQHEVGAIMDMESFAILSDLFRQCHQTMNEMGTDWEEREEKFGKILGDMNGEVKRLKGELEKEKKEKTGSKMGPIWRLIK